MGSQERTSKIKKFGIFKDLRNYILIIILRKTNPNAKGEKTPTNNTKTETAHPPSKNQQGQITERVGYL